MIRSKWFVNAILLMVALFGVSSILAQCAVSPPALPTQSAPISEITEAEPVVSTVSPEPPIPTATPTMPTLSPTPDAPILPPGGPSAATNLQSIVECESPGKAVARLSWTPAASPGATQRVDVTIYTFEGDQFESSKLLPPDQDSLVWEQLKGQAIHDWRVLTLQADGWVPSEIAGFEGPTCVVEVLDTPTPPIVIQ